MCMSRDSSTREKVAVSIDVVYDHDDGHRLLVSIPAISQGLWRSTRTRRYGAFVSGRVIFRVCWGKRVTGVR